MEKKIKIKAKDKDLKGSYSNLMQVLHTKEEFLLDFFLVSRLYPPKFSEKTWAGEGILVSRIVMSPSHIKRMVRALSGNLLKYEEKFGKIETAKVPERTIGFNVVEP